MSELVKKVKLEAMKTLKSAMASHEDGRWDEAAQLYTAIVAVLPESADAWALCGLLKYQRGYKPEAAKLFKKALSVNQEQPIAKNFFTQIENDVNVDVKSYCSDTIDREYVIEKLFEISNSQDHLPSDDKAEQDEEMRQLDSPIARDNLSKGLELQEAGRIIEALALISKAAEIEPRSPYLRFRLGNLLGSLERWDEAIKELSTVIADNPLYGAVYNDRATIYFKQGKLEEAYQDIEKAAVLLANSAQVHRNKGYVLVKKRQLAAAAVSYNKALSIDPESAETYNNLGMALEGMGRLDDARIFYGKAIEKDDKLSLAHWNKGLMSLRMGDFKDGWPLFEKRWQTQMAGKERTYIYPLWDGKSDINGKTILIHYEQGLGDVIQFSRYVKLIEAKGATVVLEVQLPLVSLLKNITDKVTVIASMDGLADKYDRKIDLRCPIMSLPALLKTGTDKIPAEIPYIYASPEKVKLWKEKIKKKTDTPQVGVAWAGRSSHNNDHNRSIRLDEFSKLFEREIEFHSLHVDYRETDQEKIKCWQNVQDHSNELNDFSDTAGLIANLDLIISVDTSVAHLAGAMGKPVWMLLPSWPDWRWMADRQDTPWYPTIKLYRQRYGDFDSNNAWKTVIDSIASDIESISKKGTNQWSEFGSEPNDKNDFPCKTQPEDNLKIRDPDFAASLKVIINKYQSAKYTEAKQDCEKLLDSFPDNYHVLTLLGNICYELKDYRLAADSIERSLEKNGRQFEALNLLGLIKQDLGSKKDAQKLFEKVIEMSPMFSDAYLNLGNLMYQARKFESAIGQYEKVIELNTSDADAHFNLGNIYRELAQWEKAVDHYDKCIRINSEFANAYMNKASVLRQTDFDLEALKTYDDAVRYSGEEKQKLFYQRAMVLIQLKRSEEAKLDMLRLLEISDKNNAETYQKHAHLLMLLEQNAEAKQSIQKTLELDPTNAAAYHTQGRLLANLEEWAEAVASYTKAITLDPKQAVFYANRSGALIEMGRFEESLVDCEKGSKLFGLSADLLMNKAVALDQLGRSSEGLVCYDEALRLHPGNALTHFNKSLLNLRSGNLIEGFAGYERRWETSSFIKNEKTYPYPLWDGKLSLKGKTIFLHHEQGFGDTVQFCRYIEKLSAMAQRIILGVPEALVEFLKSLKTKCDIVSSGAPVKQIDYRLPLMSLPYIFKTSLEHIPGQVPYLFTGPEKERQWALKLGNSNRKKIGLVWSGRSEHKNDKNRSLKLKMFEPLMELNADFHSLNKDIREIDLSSLNKIANIKDHRPDLNNFADTAALISNLDLVISVDTSVAHVAGALNIPVWILLPYTPDWRWLKKRSDSPWYPSATLYRQRERGEWNYVIGKISQDLRSFIENRPEQK